MPYSNKVYTTTRIVGGPEENDQYRQQFQNHPPAAGGPRADLDLNQHCGSPEKRLYYLFPIMDGDGKDHVDTSEPGTKRVCEDTQQSYGPKFGHTPPNSKQLQPWAQQMLVVE